MVGDYAHALAAALDENRAFFPDLTNPRSQEMSDRGLRAVHEVERLFTQAAAPHPGEVRRADPEAALGVAGRVITGTCPQSRARGDMPDRAEWARLADELSAMAVAYLLTADTPRPGRERVTRGVFTRMSPPAVAGPS